MHYSIHFPVCHEHQSSEKVKISDDDKNIISTVKFQFYDTCSPEIVTKILLEAKNLALI